MALEKQSEYKLEEEFEIFLEFVTFLIHMWVRTCVGVTSGKKARISHTCFRCHFARTHTRATAHRMCACAHTPLQPIPWNIISRLLWNNIRY